MKKFLSTGFWKAAALLFITTNSISRAQVSWTPIYVDTSNRLDLWTIKETGCGCPDDLSSTKCACCVKPGGCLCSFNHNKCAQCGLEESCQRFCNTTTSSRVVASKSGLSWVQIKSPVLEGPTVCFWRFESAPGQRIEVQIHRLVAVGTFDNSTQKCVRGFLQFAEGDISVPSSQAIQMCAENSRYSPPVVFFGDQSVATLLLRIDVKTSRSQVLAYISFSSADDPAVGNSAKGGRLRPHSVCDSTYENCWNNECLLTSPGYPGLFPPHRRCRYFLSANSTSTKIRIQFHSVNFPPPPLCSTHHIAIWKRNASNLAAVGPPLKTFCSEHETTFEVEEGQALLEFRSGPPTFPYIYTGFKASVLFINRDYGKGSNYNLSPNPSPKVLVAHQSESNTPPPLRPFFPVMPVPAQPSDLDETVEEPLGNDRASQEYEGVSPITCGHIFFGDDTRGTVFRLIIPKDTTLHSGGGIRSFGQYLTPPKKKPPPGPFKCQIEFRGRPSDIVQFAVFAYKFRGSNCSTVLELYDVESEQKNQSDRLLGKLCGPSCNEVKRFASSHSKMALVTLLFPQDEPLGTEFLEGAFRFHDESMEGTVKPPSDCEVVYYGVTSAPTGSITGPPDSPLLRLSTYPLLCAHSFVPGVNQSVSLLLNRAGHETLSIALPNSMKYCRSICGSSGCRCEAKYTPLHQIDHLLLVAGSVPIGCLCGYFSDILPMAFESHTPLTLVYHATQNSREFTYTVRFQFKNKTTCANFSVEPPSSSRRWKDILGSGLVTLRNPQAYSYFQCAWQVSIPSRYRLTLDFISEEDEEDCRTWNLTLWADDHTRYKNNEEPFFSFCPNQGRSEIQVPDSVQNAYIRLTGVTLRPPQFEIRWKYFDVVLGSGLVVEKTVSNGANILYAKTQTLISDSSLVPMILVVMKFLFVTVLVRPVITF